MNLKQRLTELLEKNGISSSQFSIDDPKDYVMNFASVPMGYEVWFQDDGGKYSLQSYTDLNQAVYDFVTRMSTPEMAKLICAELAKGE